MLKNVENNLMVYVQHKNIFRIISYRHKMSSDDTDCKQFYIVRHGEIYHGNWWTWRTLHLVFLDRDDPPLSDVGLTKSEILGKNILDEGFVPEFIVTSPFTRCIQTSTQLQKAFGNKTKIIIEPLLGEFQYGWEHFCASYPQGLPQDHPHEDTTINTPYPEAVSDLIKRCEFTAENIMKKYNNAIFVTHASIVELFANYFKGTNYGEKNPIDFSGYIKITKNFDGYMCDVVGKW
jgi:broad specificity phosphatase PhoE